MEVILDFEYGMKDESDMNNCCSVTNTMCHTSRGEINVTLVLCFAFSAAGIGIIMYGKDKDDEKNAGAHIIMYFKAKSHKTT